MPIAPLRDFGALGVNADVDSYALPNQALSFSANARFENKLITRGPISRTQGTLLTAPSPRHIRYFQDSIGDRVVVIADHGGNVITWAAIGFSGTSTETVITEPTWTTSKFESPYTSVIENNIMYLNRADRVPWFMSKDGTQFAKLTNWDPTWLCQSIRSCDGVLVAINVTKGSTNFPTMIKTSDFTVFNTVPQAWVAAANNSATENILADLSEPLVDGWPLRGNLMLYSNHETWLMSPTGDNEVFSYQRVFNNHGALSQNCITDHNNIHYVFGPDDLWTHDGFRDKSIANGRVRNFVFNNIVQSELNQCFVTLNPTLNEVMFCYPSSDPYCAFPVGGSVGFPGCNRAAVYNYAADTWYFYDLFYATSAVLGIGITNTPLWSDLSSTPWTSFTSPWASLLGTSSLTMLTVAPTVGIQGAVRSFDVPHSASASGTIDTASSAPVQMSNMGLDTDTFGAQTRAYKVIKSIYPICRFDTGAQPMMFSFGSSDYASSPAPVFGTPMSYDGGVNYKLDYMSAGRFLSMTITYADTADFSLSGLDFDFDITGSR